MHFSTFIAGSALFGSSIAGYVLEDDYMNDFYGNFEFFTAPDPTNGFVQYVDQATAQDMGLINGTKGNAVSWGVDHTNVTPEGRPSVRITSKKSYEHGLVVLDVAHMPSGCGTWPAFWMVGPSWPDNGEIDILEGVNDQQTNSVALHTGPGCSIQSSQGGGAAFAGTVKTDNCDVDAPDQDKNAGCAVKQTETNSYGAGLNANNGGVYATEWTNDAISVWFFPRGDIPEDVLGAAPNPKSWGLPVAKFASKNCDIKSMFNKQQIVFDTTFCGDWAGNAWSSGSCAKKAETCDSYVENNPEAFANAYWTINDLKVYKVGEGPEPSAPVEPSPSSSRRPNPSGVPSESPVIPTNPTLAPPKITDSFPTETPVLPTNPTLAPPQITDSFPTNSPVIPTNPTLAPPKITDSLPTGEVPSVIPEEPSAPIPTDTPRPTKPTRRPRSSRTRNVGRPTDINSQIAAVPSNRPVAGPMSGFQWPRGGGGGSPGAGTTAAPAKPTGEPLPSGGAPASSASPSTAPVQGGQPAPTGSPGVAPAPTPTTAAPVSPTGVADENPDVVETVYQTVYVTVGAPAATPAAGSRRARRARQQRKRIVQHHARR